MYGLLFTYMCCILMMNVDIPYVDPMDNSDLPRGDPWISDPSTPRRSVILQSSKFEPPLCLRISEAPM